MKVYRDLVENGVLVSKEIFDIAECTYTGKDMGERSITATIYFATPIDFQIGDYIKLPMQNLIRSTSGVNGSIASGSGEVEKFYIYTMPTMKKVARAMENGKAFEHTVTFYPAQYELSCVQMRDLGNSLSADEIIYTGFDSVSFNGGAKELMDRIMMVLKEAYHDSEGNPLWSYEISDTVNEDVNLALERFPISFSGNTVMDALLELNNKETINTTFFINNRKIYVGFKRPYFCRVTDGMSIDTNPSSQLFTFQYGKTSDKGVALQYGGLYDITKSVGKEVPITKLFAYGASRNLNRYYCSDRVKGGRYVNRLMLPSFDTDGKTDFIISEEALQRYGVREATKQFEEIYPSIRYATYGDIRQVKYCIKVKASGVKNENIDNPSYPVARIQCYKIVEGEKTGVNKLVEAAPPDDLAVYIHAMDKVVKVVLYGGATDAEAISKQRQHDTKVPTYTSGGSDYIPGACFIVHDRGFDEAGTVYENANRSAWFTSIDNLSGFTEKQKEEIKLNQINYTDTFWLTDLYIFQEYKQAYFSRDGYSAWSWARLNSKYTSLQGSIASDSVVVNEIVHVEPITISDTNMTADGIDKRQSTFDIYLRDLGFTINEQNDFGDMVFLQNGTVKVSILDGLLAGQEFEISGSINSTSPSCICAFNDDGTRNEAFFEEPDYTTDGTNPQTPYDAFEKGAIWRIRLNRTNVDEADYANLNLAMPTKEINAKQGDHLVLLDIFMPDIYIHAAENRLLREARKYLEANDNGSISYAVNFDKVRMQQIPNYAMQLREGLNLRVVDEDLNIKTENNGRYIADYRDNKLYSQRTLDNGKKIDWISANAPIDFTRSKYYIVEFSIFNSSAFDINAFNFALFKSKNEESISFVPEFTVEQEVKGMEIILKVKFQLPDNFDDGQLYYPSIYLNQLKSWYDIIDMYLISVFERDFDENTNILNYADFTIDSLTVKITDNSGDNEPIREITATLSEQTNATAWATLMNRVATTAKEGAQNKKALEEVANNSRKYTQALTALKNSIFDPDGTCNQTFLQVMMMQTGADSMNYQMDNTRMGVDGVYYNCNLERQSDGFYHFIVYNSDTLRHFVFTDGSQAGNWEIPTGTGLDVQLDGTSTYFVCLKCPKNDNTGQWVVSTKQYAVNDPEDDTAWFFNWGILTVDSGGVYTLMETRGNAYMYGDNLVCGKIKTLAGNSYFDLTNGNFVLSKGITPALQYIDGVLTIGGVATEEDAQEILSRLGLLQNDVNNVKYVDISNVTNISLSIRSQVMTLADVAVKLATSRYKMKFQKGSETALSPFSTSCIAIVDKGQNVSHSTVIDLVKWGEEYTPTTEVDAYFLPADKEYFIEYAFPNLHDHIEYDMKEVWTTNNVQVLVESGDYLKMLQAEMSAKEESTMEAIAGLKDIQDSLQSQIDGEVTSWFYDKAPVDTSDNVLTDIEPMSEWLKNYTFANGVYTLKSGERNELVNHIGDTYTNMEEYKVDDQGNTTTPLAGLSWRWCDATTVNPLPSKYITIRYSQNGSVVEKKLHWHKIADSDAVKALQEAGKAQATADGKSTIFTTQPSNYSVGDMWILMEDTRVGGTLYKKGTILNSSDNSETFNYSHWSEDVKYIDEDIARQQAQQALDGLIVGGTNLIPAVGFSSSDSNQTITKLQEELYSQGVYQVTKITNLTPPASSYNITRYVTAGKTYVASVYIRCDTAPSGTSNTKWGRIIFYGKNASGANVTYAESNIDAEPIVGQWYQRQVVYTIPSDFDASKETINIYCYAPSAADVKSSMSCIKLEEGNKATPTYNMPISSIAQWAEESLQQLSDMSNDGILTPQEKKNVSNEWSEIQGMYSVNSNNVTSLFGSSKPTEWTEYNNNYSALEDYIETLNLGSGSNTTITKTVFQDKFSEYYNADVNLQKAIAKKSAELEVAAMEIGGRNLLRNSATFTHVAGSTDNYSRKTLTPTVGLQPNTNYVFSVDKSEMTAGSDTAFTVYLFSSDIKTGRNKLTIPISSTRQSVSFKTTAAVTNTDVVLIYAGQHGTTAGKAIKLTNIKLEQGTKATDWTPAPEDVDDAIAAVDSKAQALEYLKTALTDGSTEIAGGLTMTNVLMLKNLADSVTAGMSGLTTYENKEDKVLMWGGGTYEEAYAAANNDTYSTGNGTITTLLKKDGTGKIGIFRISDTQAVVKTNQGEVLIDSTDNNGGVYVKNKSGKIKAAIVNGKVEDYAPLEDEVIVSKDVNIKSDTYNNGVFAEGSSGTCTTSRSVTFNLKQHISVSEPCYCKVSVKVYGRLTQGFYNTEYKSSNATIQFTMNGEAKSPLSNSISKNTLGYAQNGISPGQYFMEISRPIQSASNPMATYNHNAMYLYPNKDFEVKVDVNTLSSGAGWCLAKLTGDLTFVIEVTRLWSYGYEPKTIVATDGVMSAYDNKNFFVVKNTSNGQKIYAKGLSATKGTAGSGELYISNSSNAGLVKTLKESFETLKTFFNTIRYEGSNKTAREAASSAIDSITSALDGISIVANS